MTDIPDPWLDRLSEYLDGDLAPVDRTALEAHLKGCAACRAALADLGRIVARARGLEGRGPTRNLWPGIAARIGAGTPARRRWTFSLPQLAAASIALMTLSGGTVWLVRGAPSRMTAITPAPALPPANPPVVLTHGTPATGRYDAAVADLERILAEGRGRLDTATVRVIEQNLTAIDRAIAQAQRAVAVDSANLYLNAHLAATMRRKIELLRQAAALITAES